MAPQSGKMDWKPWNDALSSLHTSVHQEIVDAAHNMDAEIWRTHRRIVAGTVSLDDWFTLRDRIDVQRLSFVNAVRHHITGLEPLHRLGGRPAPYDPIWHIGGTSGEMERSAEA